MNVATPKCRAPEGRLLLLALTLAAGLVGGCATRIGGTAVKASNVYTGGDTLPTELRRVAVLPLTVTGSPAHRDQVREGLEPILLTELAKTERFELVPVQPERLRQWFGRTDWHTTDTFPTNFFSTLRQETDCDAVLFSQLTQYRPYPPLAMGWRIQLLDVRTMRVSWAVDEVFDASDSAVARAAGHYHLEHSTQPRSMTDGREILNSPLRFARYTASVVAATCPQR